MNDQMEGGREGRMDRGKREGGVQTHLISKQMNE